MRPLGEDLSEPPIDPGLARCLVYASIVDYRISPGNPNDARTKACLLDRIYYLDFDIKDLPSSMKGAGFVCNEGNQCSAGVHWRRWDLMFDRHVDDFYAIKTISSKDNILAMTIYQTHYGVDGKIHNYIAPAYDVVETNSSVPKLKASLNRASLNTERK